MLTVLGCAVGIDVLTMWVLQLDEPVWFCFYTFHLVVEIHLFM